MRSPMVLVGWVLLLSLAIGAPLRGEPDAQAGAISALVAQLGDGSYALRESASQKLEALGETTLPILRTAAAGSPDLEVRLRAQQIIYAILLAACKSKSIGLEMSLIDAGTFHLGSPDGETGRRPDELQHRVTITRPVLMGVFEVTQHEYLQVMKINPSWFAASGPGKDKVAGLDTARFPVERVTWFDAVEFCNRLSERDGLKPFYQLQEVEREGESIKKAQIKFTGGTGYRLPTEAEWEYACRAGTGSPFNFGGGSNGNKANVKGVSSAGGYGAPVPGPDLGRTAKAGSYEPNRWGLYDMHGNAAEWCGDWYGMAFYAAAPAVDPQGPDEGHQRVLRSGSWLVNEGSARSASRFLLAPTESNYYTGFRVCRSP